VTLSTSKKKTAAILLIRSGSKRVLDKNIKIISGKPLFWHITTKCLFTPEIDKVFISIDSSKYLKIVNKFFGNNDRVEVIKRPTELSGDNSKSEDSMLHVIDTIEVDSAFYDYYVLVQATNPLTNSADISKAIQLIVGDKSLNSVFSAAESKKFYLEDTDTLLKRPMTQEKPIKLYEVGCFWCVKSSKFREIKNRIISPYKYILVDEYSALDIDTEKDMTIVELLLSKEYGL
jgi:CMP-N-acetylneuraminic acid synthetase